MGKKTMNREKITSWKDLWQSFVYKDIEEKSQEEAILSDGETTITSKEELIRTLKKVEKQAEKFIENSYKTNNLKIDKKPQNKYIGNNRAKVDKEETTNSNMNEINVAKSREEDL